MLDFVQSFTHLILLVLALQDQIVENFHGHVGLRGSIALRLSLLPLVMPFVDFLENVRPLFELTAVVEGQWLVGVIHVHVV